MRDGSLNIKSFIQISRLNIRLLVPARVSEKLQRAFSISERVTGRWMKLSSKNTVQSEAWRSCIFQLSWAQMYRFTVRLNNWWVKMTGLIARYEAGSQVFLRIKNFKSLRQVASYAI